MDMTVTALSAWIALGLALQLCVWMAFAFSSHLGRYRSLREQVARSGMPLEPVAPASVETGLAAPACFASAPPAAPSRWRPE